MFKKVTRTQAAVGFTLVGYVSLLVGCLLLSVPLGLIVGGGSLLAVGVLIDEPSIRSRRRQ